MYYNELRGSKKTEGGSMTVVVRKHGSFIVHDAVDIEFRGQRRGNTIGVAVPTPDEEVQTLVFLSIGEARELVQLLSLLIDG